MYKLTHQEHIVIKLPDPNSIPVVNGIPVTCGEQINIRANTPWALEYKNWVLAGNQPLPADPIPDPAELTVEEKLQRSGLTLEELKGALGL